MKEPRSLLDVAPVMPVISVRDQPALARAVGAEFLVATLGAAPLCAAMRDTELPHLPGVATAPEAMQLLDDGYTDMVLHPADAVRRGDWGRIRRLAEVAVTLSRPAVTAVRAL
ncbi:hypothetical protein [Mycolicibacterium pyrenivorans]|uniref:hypothetical protein n=1 Tax=Mycolicibacterium pyrenivorans TaxID=187102 RepID=UPI0021F3A840|nr:hypothetical protein [Mycolicibacterium pyrenivorans]MCV7150847.1 hypothetical protein [Mycolicibacterium pyrenivorans]